MKIIDVFFNGKHFVFRTNDSGNYLFVGVSENTQISHASGFQKPDRIKRAVREYLKSRFDCDVIGKKFPRVRYVLRHGFDEVPNYGTR